jgi:ABC-type bacteriocin/lantibiotic exporter with double-glycine peptidase domain
MRALLYIVQQLGRPISEAELRSVAALPRRRARSRLLPAVALGAWASTAMAVDLGRIPPQQLSMPFALVCAEGPAAVVVSLKNGRATMLDVVEGPDWARTACDSRRPGTQALVVTHPVAAELASWHAPIWTELRPTIARLAGLSFAVNLLALASPLFMMLVVNRWRAMRRPVRCRSSGCWPPDCSSFTHSISCCVSRAAGCRPGAAARPRHGDEWSSRTSPGASSYHHFVRNP